MMGKGGERGYGEEKFLRFNKQNRQCRNREMFDKNIEMFEMSASAFTMARGVSVYSQASKALSLSLPLVEGDAGAAHSIVSVQSHENKQKNRLKKLQMSGSTQRAKIQKNWSCDISSTQVWSYVDEYFREVTSDDIQMLLPSTNLKGALDFHDECLLVPPLGRLGLSEEAEEVAKDALISGAKRKLSTGQDTKKRKKPSKNDLGVVITVISPTEYSDNELCHVCYCGESKEDNQILFCDHCNVAVHQECYGVKVAPEGQWMCSWCRDHSTASRKSNRMQDNSLIEDRLNMNKSRNHSWHCVLCPSKGGALKPIAKMDDDLAHLKPEGSRFAHLFCCQWIPEMYIPNTGSMEPIRNVGAVSKGWKLLCSICRVKHGACIQCSHGACATAFHPLCARQARFRMEVHSKENTDDVDLQAFCQKHSVRNDKTSANRSTQSGTTEVTMQDVVGSPPKSDCLLEKEEPGEIVVDKHHSTYQKGESEVDHIGGGITSTAGKSLRKLLNRSGSSSDESDSTTETSGAVICSGVGSAISSSKDTAAIEEVEANCTIRDLKDHLKKAMEQLQISKTDLAVRIGVSSDALFTWLQNKKQMDRKVAEKIEGWLSNHASGTANDNSEESSQFVKGLRDLLKTFKASLRKGQKREGKPSIFLGNCLEKGSAMVDKLIMPEHVSAHQKEGSKMENESTQIEASIVATYEMSMHKSSLAEGDEYAACTIDSGYSQKDGTSPASVCLDSDCVSNSERRQRGLSGEASTSYAFTKFAGEELYKARQPLMNCGLERKQEIEGCATSSYPGTLPSKNAGNVCNRVKEEYSTEDTSTATGLQILKQCNSAKRDMVTFENLLVPEQVANDMFCAPGLEIASSAAPASGLFMMDKRQSGYCEELKSVLASGPKTCLKGAINPSIHRLIRKQLVQAAEVDLVYVGKGAEHELGNSVEVQWKQIEKARQGGLLEDLSSDEVEEEIVGLQSSLITHARRNQQCCENLILNVITNVWDERQVLRKRKEDLLLVDKYLKEVMESKKKGRKERRNKEAQADLAAATAAAAASSRLGASRRGDGSSVLAFEMKPTSIGDSLFMDRNAQSSETGFPIPIATVTVSRLSKPNIATVRSGSSSSVPSPLNEMALRPVHRVPKDETQIPKSADEDPLCEICRNKQMPTSSKIIVCHECKVVVHADCYGVSRSVLTPWYCEVCLEFLQQRQSQNHVGQEISRASVKCLLCCQHTGAFKRSSSGGWVHIFCAQWVREAIIGKDQSTYVNGLESIPAERFSLCCSICCFQQGATFRCNFGHCHTAFHATCARDAGLYISIKTKCGGGILYRGYCGKHSSQQKEKEQSKCSGSIDDWNVIVEMRVELERVRLLCERLIKRERLKRDVLNCTKDCYSSHMKAIALLALRLNSHDKSSPGISESRGGKRVKFEYIERERVVEDDRSLRPVSDSMIPAPQWLGIDNQEDESVMTQSKDPYVLSGSKAESRSFPDNCLPQQFEAQEKSRGNRQRKSETLQTEVVMTPTEASVQNKKLPKGYAYVPVGFFMEGKLPDSATERPDIL